MKKSIFIAIVFIAFTNISSQLFAQEAAKNSGYDLKKNVKCRVSTTETGCSIVFESAAPSPETASGMATTKKGYDYYQAKSSFSVSASDNSVTEVSSPRDAASGLATGRRMHEPMFNPKEYSKSSPKLAESASSTGTSSDASAVKGSGGGSGKVNVQDISFTKRCGGKTSKISCDGGDCEIPTGDCPDGDCSITADWSWGLSQGGSSKRCSVDFLLEITDGVCHTINTKGTGGTRSGK
jgi:hypothetical protein